MIPPKVAVCFFGHLRTFKKCLPFLRKNLLNLYDCDIFMHTWDKSDHNSKTWHKNRMTSIKPVDKDKIKRLLNITDEQLIVETQSADDGKNVYHYEHNTFSLFGLNCVWHAMQTVNKLRQQYAKSHKVNYDAVIFIRPDILINTKIKALDTLPNNNSLYFVGNMVGVINDITHIKASDILFWAKPDVIDKIMKEMTLNIKNGQILSLPPEGLFLEKVIAAGYTLLFDADYKYGRDFMILRPTNFNFKFPNDLVSLHVRRKGISLHVLRMLCPIFNITVNFFNRFLVVFSIGRSTAEKE